MRALSVLAGMLLAAMCVAGLGIDTANNWQYGATVSHELASVLLVAAIGVAAFPVAAAVAGWNWLFRLGTIACVFLTIVAAFLAYTTRQGEVAASRQTTADGYESARTDEADARQAERVARAEAAGIAELATVDELQTLVGEAKAKADREAGRGSCQGKCEAAKDAHSALLGRLGQAKAKAAALARAEASRQRMASAQGRATGGAACHPMSALWIAAHTGWEAAAVQQSIDIGFAIGAILATQILALLGHPAVLLIMRGIEQTGQRGHVPQCPALSLPIKKPRPEPKPRPVPRKRRASRKAPAAVVGQVQAWADAALIGRPGGSAAATDAHAAFVADTGSDLSQAAFGTAMAEIGFSKCRRGGRVIYTGVAFKQAVRLAAVN